MSRTSKALRRLSVPVLVGSVIMTGVSSLGFAGVANAAPATNGSLAVTATPQYQTIDDGSYTVGPVAIDATYTTGTNTTVPQGGAQYLTLTTSSPTATFSDTGTSTTTCTTAAPVGAAPQTVACPTKTMADTVSEPVTVTVQDIHTTSGPGANNDQTAAASASTTVHFASLKFDNCPADGTNTPANCVAQVQAGTTTQQTLTYKQDGQGKGGVTVNVAIAGGSTTFSAVQPSGGGCATITSTLVQCTTLSAPASGLGVGQVKIEFTNNSSGPGQTSTLTASTSNTGLYPQSSAKETVNSFASTVPGRIDETSSTPIFPSGGTAYQPGTAVQKTYTLYSSCTPAATFATCTGNALAGVSVALTVDHGFFTPNCTHAATTNYDNCSFTPTPTHGAVVGNLTNSGTTKTVVTDASGNFTVTLGIARDTGFDNNGLVAATVSGVATGNSSSITAGNPTSGGLPANERPSNTTCASTPSAASCPSVTTWTTRNRPLNGLAVSFKAVDGSDITGNPNNVPQNQSREFIVQATDQFQNLTNDGLSINHTPVCCGSDPSYNYGSTTTSSIKLVQTGAGTLYRCTRYSNTDPCMWTSQSSTATTTDSSGAVTQTYADVVPSYNGKFDSTGAVAQDRFLATSDDLGNGKLGVQTDTATWTAPVTLWNTYAAATSSGPAVASYTQDTATKTAVVKFNFYDQTAQPVVTFSTTPSNTVSAGTVVTVSATVKDQFGQPIPHRNVQFLRSGPNESSCNPSYPGGYTQATGPDGRAGFTFTCNTPGTSSVTIIVTDSAGNEIARGVQNVTFTNGTPPGNTTGDPGFTLNVRSIAAGQCAVLTATGTAGHSIEITGASAPSFTPNHVATLQPGQSIRICPTTTRNYRAEDLTTHVKSLSQTEIVKAVQTLVVTRNGQSANYAGHVAPSLAGRSVVVFYYTNGEHVQYGGLGKVKPGGNYSFSGRVNRPGKVVHFFAQTYKDDYNAAGRSRLVDVQF